MDNLNPITHKELNEFIKGKGFKGRNNYKLKELKAMFGFKPMVIGSPRTISRAGELRLILFLKLQHLLEYHTQHYCMPKGVVNL